MLLALVLAGCAQAQQKPAAGKKPNILIIWGDDIGYWNVSAYNQGMMVYRTPNIDRISRAAAPAESSELAAGTALAAMARAVRF